MKEFQPFAMERMMSRFEQRVDYNLSESGVHPVKLRELLADNPDQINHLLEAELNYPYVNGIPELRNNIASLYNGAQSDNILVTVGAIEANYITTRTLLSEGDEIVVMLPNYMQIWGISRNHNYKLETFHLREENNWALDLDELNKVVSDQTRLIAVCNPNNPTGYILNESEMEVIVKTAERVGAWILADEVYSGVERLTDVQSPSFYGLYDKVVATSSLSKAYGLPGLRLGWLAGPVATIDKIWARHEYITLSATMLSNILASLALSEQVRPRLIQRARDYIRRGYPILERWMSNQENLFSVIPPQAAAIAFVRYHLDINSSLFCERLCQEKSVFVVPGDHFGMDRFLRISFGLPEEYLTAGLNRIQELISELH